LGLGPGHHRLHRFSSCRLGDLACLSAHSRAPSARFRSLFRSDLGSLLALSHDYSSQPAVRCAGPDLGHGRHQQCRRCFKAWSGAQNRGSACAGAVFQPTYSARFWSSASFSVLGAAGSWSTVAF
jgi:hypothetical protein